MPDKDDKDQPQLAVAEADDGTAVITFASDDKSLRAEIRDDDAPAAAPADDAHHEGEGQPDAAETAELAAAQTDEEREQIRERRRLERKQKKERQRTAMESKDRMIHELRRQNAELAQRVGAVENRSFASDLARIDAGITQAAQAEKEAKEAMAEATASQNGQALAEAQELWYEAKKRQEQLSGVKDRLTQAVSRERQGARQAAPAPDPQIQRQGTAWMSKHAWYDPAGGNQDSRVALAVDSQLIEDGFDPRTQEYWDELDSRLKNYLPHRYKAVYDPPGGQPGNGGSGAGGRVERTGVTTTGSGRSAAAGGGASNRFQLSKDRVDAMKEAGIWDDPARRDAMIRRYREHDMKNAKRS